MTQTPVSPTRPRRAAGASAAGSWLFVTLQRLLPQHVLSRAVHCLARARLKPLKNALIGAFVRRFRPQMSEASEPDPHLYGSFNELFTRALKPGARRVDSDPSSVVSPVDGTVSQIGYLDGLTLLQAKGRTYRLDALLAAHAWTPRFAGGAFATLYLAPRDYHRIHMPLAAQLRAAWYVPGRLFSVNTTTAEAVGDLFARNERVACAFETASGLPLAMVLVGALFVGSIATQWHGEVAPRRPRRALDLPVPYPAPPLAKGSEMGHFNMGSTVILLFPRDAVAWLPELAAASRIRMGQPLARLLAAG
ncbi:MAG: archaetidylserine decarboxylase [Steroidobacteraceae bacterium]